MFDAIDHPAIACHDVAGQIEWYCRHLGLRVIARKADSPPSAIVGYGTAMNEGAVNDGAMIELMPVRDQGTAPEAIGRFAPGLRHLAFRVADFEQAYAALKAAGVRFVGEVGTALGGGKIVSFRDPEGNELQIVERPKAMKQQSE